MKESLLKMFEPASGMIDGDAALIKHIPSVDTEARRNPLAG